MKVYIIAAAIGIIAVGILEFLSKNNSNKKRSNIYAWAVVLLTFVIQVINCNMSIKQDKENAELLDTIKTSGVRIIKIEQTLDSTTEKLSESKVILSEIKDALKNSKLWYDSINKEIKPIMVNSKFYLPNTNIKGGNNQFGDGNTQNN